MSDPSSVTTAFAEALDRQPRHWPRIDWLKEKPSPDITRFVNGDFSIELRRSDAGWCLYSAVERNRRARSLWWAWLVAGLVYMSVAMTLAITHDRRWLWGLGALPAAGARFFFDLSHRLRRGGTRIPIRSLYERE